eukprot:scaffold4897_cov272-Chaetoceros_neogracile.AAC.6
MERSQIEMDALGMHAMTISRVIINNDTAIANISSSFISSNVFVEEGLLVAPHSPLQSANFTPVKSSILYSLIQMLEMNDTNSICIPLEEHD